ncbi:cytosine deaminase [Oscillatoria sp. FACHB-1407]|nr:cytosine deaminase [Oscillatoria sp. FACHB-1407]MBD2459625.1 cytosine deaminase [Oscillatoria sp. FACHB-1407]
MHLNFTHLRTNHYWLTNAHVPYPLLVGYNLHQEHELAHVDLEIQQGTITQIRPHGTPIADDVPAVNLNRGQVWSGFVDMHTHLDKGHIWQRSPNRSGTFQEALQLIHSDSEKNWDAEDVYRRMEFGLKCSYAHGTTAIRTHIDSAGNQGNISFRVFKTLQAEWSDRLTLQAVCLVPIDYFQTPEGEKLADLVAETGGILGAVLFMNDNLDAQIDRVFQLAAERQLKLDFHTDESGNPNDITLRRVAHAVLRHNFGSQVVCGHCCSLAVQSSDDMFKTLEAVKQANIGIVSLPMCNLYLQDRNQDASQHFAPLSPPVKRFPTQTPRWRGITLIHELKHAGVPVAVASDNCRDPFYGYGDHDVLEVFTQATRIAHFDAPLSDWCRTVTTIPADLMGLPTVGRIGVGLPADLVLFKARYFSELLARPQSDRVVLRSGQPIDTTLPDYSELDDLLIR